MLCFREGLEQGLLFMGVTDRGPNQGCDDVADLGIGVPSDALEVCPSASPCSTPADHLRS